MGSECLMTRKKKRAQPPERPVAADFKNQPFRKLQQILPAVSKTPPATPSSRPVPLTAPAPPPEPTSEADLFLRAVRGARPLAPAARARVEVPAPAAEPRQAPDPDAEALAELCDLVSGSAPFDISDSDEYVEGHVAGLEANLLRRLRRGEFCYQAHLDLHGLTRDEARTDVDAFVREAYQAGKRCVLIIHGRGLNSKDNIPVLKGALLGWLTRGTLGRLVLAFTSARACDGGAGALYVLLRRHPKKAAFVVTNGARR